MPTTTHAFHYPRSRKFWLRPELCGTPQTAGVKLQIPCGSSEVSSLTGVIEGLGPNSSQGLDHGFGIYLRVARDGIQQVALGHQY